MKISFNCTDDQQVVHTHKDAGLSDQVPCSKPDISPEAYLNDYRNRMPFHYIEEGSDGYYYWQYGSIMDLVINFVDEIAQSEDVPDAVIDVRVDDKSVVDPVAGIAHLGSMALKSSSEYYTLQQTDKIVGILSQQIKDLQEGGVASIVDTPENLMPGQLLMWDSEARRLVGSPLIKGDSEKSIILKTSSSDPNFAFHEGTVLLGKGLSSSFPYQVVLGYYNKLIPEEVFSVGTGFSNATRSTAFSISRSGKVKVFNPPVDIDDVVRKQELDAVKAISDNAVVANDPITAGTHAKITYDSKGLVIEGSDLTPDDIPQLSASKITSGTFSDDRIASAATWNAKQDALTALQLSAVNSGITSEKVAIYDGYAETISEKLDKSGGTITGSLTISQNLVVSGTTSTVDTQNLKVADKLIYVAKDNTVALTSPAGLITPKYDGINNGGIVYDNTGTAYVGDVTLDSEGNVDVNNSDLQPIATRDTTITDGNIVKWDDTAKKLVDAGVAISTLEKLIVKGSEISNPNLLVNPDFSINQRGQTSYTGTGYSVDRWKGYQLNEMVCTPRNGYGVTLSAPTEVTSTGGIYFQPLETAQLSKLAGRTVTVSFKVSANRGTSNIYVRTVANGNNVGDTPTITSGAAGIVSKTITLPSPLTSLEIIFRKGAGTLDVDIDWIKLEIGSTPTEFVPPVIEEELLKCQALDTDPVQLLRSTSGAFVGLTVGQSIEKIVFNPNVSTEKMTSYLASLTYDEQIQGVNSVCELLSIDADDNTIKVYAINFNSLNVVVPDTSGYGIAVINTVGGSFVLKQAVFATEYNPANATLVDSIKDPNYTYEYTEAGWVDTKDYLLNASTNHTIYRVHDNKVNAFIGINSRFFETTEMLNGASGGSYVLTLSEEASLTVLQAKDALKAFNSGKSVICQMPGFFTATLMSVIPPDISSTGDTIMTFFVDIGDAIVKVTLNLPVDAVDSDVLTFNHTEFRPIATASDIATITL